MTTHALIVLVLFVFGGIGPCFLIWRYEKRRYNNGYCACGERWIHFDCDSQGGHMWKCERCGSYLDTSWIRPRNIYYGKVKH